MSGKVYSNLYMPFIVLIVSSLYTFEIFDSQSNQSLLKYKSVVCSIFICIYSTHLWSMV